MSFGGAASQVAISSASFSCCTFDHTYGQSPFFSEVDVSQSSSDSV